MDSGGLTQQTAVAIGGYRTQGRTAEDALELARSARALQDAGSFVLVFERSRHVTDVIMPALDIPGIGIAAGADRQVLVFHDLLGIWDGSPARFVKRCAGVCSDMIAEVSAFAADVRDSTYPAQVRSYATTPDEVARLRTLLVPERETKRRGDA
ncbi:3-methyl-2-oxobutanoate hydroxymethyltransferase [Microbacterium mangrovi]|uniref:3-methyl-2-oxobutanoate hydroxymethyltransferase n=1 Tax=Microbacterium mangrovi TaxID=1348253 RepID=UPI00068FD176|nr:3-methyl-2-oxobutanoate hydroxymethyltransferase [Microbacterium mangrovi]